MTIAARKILNLLFVLVMVLSFSLVTAAPAQAIGNTDATLSALSLSSPSTTITPAFNSTIYTYNASVTNGVATINVNPTTNDVGATYVMRLGGPVVTNPVSLSVGDNSIVITVTASDISTTQDYTVTVNRATADNDATLSHLTLTSPNTSLSPHFYSGQTVYTASVASSVSSITVNATKNNSGASVNINGLGSSPQTVTLSLGSNTITIHVTAQDTTAQDYVVTVTVPPVSTDATLSDLTVNAGALTPLFNGTDNYTISVLYSVSSIKVTPTTTSSFATVKVNGVTVTSTHASGSIPLAVGLTVIPVVVTAQDGLATHTYYVKVTRAAVSHDATLSALAVSDGTLAPTFGPTILSYTDNVGNGVSSITVTPTTASPYASVIISPSSPVSLNVGLNTITIVVTAQDTTTTKTYTVKVNRAGIDITSPVGGVTWAVGSTHPITWLHGYDATGKYTISLSRNTGTSWTVIIANLPSTTGSYSWHLTGPDTTTAQIKVVNATGPLTAITANFAIGTIPGIPVLVSPTSGITNLDATSAIPLAWNAVAGATSYGVQVATASSFATPVLTDNTGSSPYAITGNTLEGNTQYYWRVNATNAAGTSAWSPPRVFHTGMQGPLPSDPYSSYSDRNHRLNATTVSATRIDLAWGSDGLHTLGFKIEREKTTGGTWAQIATVGPTILTYSNTTGLTANTQYSYRVRAYNAVGNSNYSNTDSAWTLPSVPTLVSPASGAINVSLPVTLKWSDASGADSYDVQISTDTQFQNIFEDGPSTSGTTYTPHHLNHNTQYYWRVDAENHGGSSDWSATLNFKTAP